MAEGLWQGKVGNIQPGEFDGFGIVFGDDVAHNDQIRGGMKVFGMIPLENRDGEIFEVVTHRGIDILIRARDMIPLMFQHARKGCHTCPANAHEVDVTQFFGYSVQGYWQLDCIGISFFVTFRHCLAPFEYLRGSAILHSVPIQLSAGSPSPSGSKRLVRELKCHFS